MNYVQEFPRWEPKKFDHYDSRYHDICEIKIFFKHNFCVKPYVPRETPKGPK